MQPLYNNHFCFGKDTSNLPWGVVCDSGTLSYVFRTGAKGTRRGRSVNVALAQRKKLLRVWHYVPTAQQQIPGLRGVGAPVRKGKEVGALFGW